MAVVGRLEENVGTRLNCWGHQRLSHQRITMIFPLALREYEKREIPRYGTELAVGLFILMLLVAPIPSTFAAEFTVDSEIDAVDATPGDGQCRTVAGECTLRAAVQETNALAGPDQVNLPVGDYVLTIPPDGSDEDSSGDLNILGALAITGGGQTSTQVSCIVDHKAFDLSFGVTDGPIQFTDLTIEHCAGGIYNNWNDLVLLERVTLFNNTYTGMKISPGSKETIIRYSTFSENSTAYEGGAIDHKGEKLIIESSTFSGNSNVLEVGRGGAIRVSGFMSTLTIVNSTFSGNRSTNESGAIHAEIYSTINIRNCTFSDNSARYASDDIGSYYDATVTISNSILTGGCEGQIVSAGNNLDQTDGCDLGGPGDLVGVDPQLKPLAHNGGPTMTQMPGSDSPVIDAGNNTPVTEDFDQRGFGYTRIINGTVDIGAVEWGTIFRDGFE